MKKPDYIHWLIKEDGKILNYKGEFKCFKIDYNNDDDVLDEWAKHIRNHYISDDELENTISLFGISKEQYLKDNILPQKSDPFGPTARVNAITEILISDLLEFIFGYEVPRVRFENMSGKTVSEHGTDVIGFKYDNMDLSPSNKDILLACEVKGVLAETDTSVITNAVEHSKKDIQRLASSLDYTRRKLENLNRFEESKKVSRFQYKPINDYIIKYSAAGITSLKDLDKTEDNGQIINVVPDVDGSSFAITNNNCIYFVHGEKLMELAHDIFERCLK